MNYPKQVSHCFLVSYDAYRRLLPVMKGIHVVLTDAEFRVEAHVRELF